MTTFERIKQTAKDRGLTLNQLNDKANLKNNIIYSWKTKTPSVENVKKVADVLGVSVDYLLGNTDEMHPKQADASAENADLKKYFDENISLQFDGREIPQEDLKIIKRILESMDDE
ncbi:helix-turn-helix domain-containing protein [Weissella viridescens]